MIGTWEIILIVLVILLIFGGKKIPELMKGLGKGVKSFKDGVNGKADEEEKKSNSEQSERSNSDSGLSFWEHLDELRSVLIKSLVAWLVASIAVFCFKEPLFELIFRPLEQGQQLINIDVTAQFFTHVQVSLCVGFVVRLPLMVAWLYGFVAPALYRNEKRYVVIFVLSALVLFAAGVALNYFLIFPLSFHMLSTYQVSDIVVNQISLTSYISLLLVLSIFLGLMFEIPVLTWLLAKLGILRREHLKRYRRHVFVAILIIAAVITPTGDPFTLLLVTLPIYMLYELSILIIPATYQISKNN